MILAGDIGGTSTRLGLYDLSGGLIEIVRIQVFRSRDYPGLGTIAKAFLADDHERVKAACFGIAGPVRQGRVSTPNLPWDTDSRELARELGLASVKLINDLEANAWGIHWLKPEDFVVLQTGEPGAEGNGAVISVGTGLGEAGLYWDGKRHIPFASEGGHADFAPRNDLEAELMSWLRTRFGRVSYERVLSGGGLAVLYDFLRDVKGRPELPALAAEMRASTAQVVITRAGLAGECPLCVEALEWYVSLYGAEAGNLALKMMATGGVFIGGGIAPRIIEKLKGAPFLESFLSKGRMRPLLEGMAVRVIMNDRTALLGAAHEALKMI